MLTDWVSWRWGLFINVPIGIALVVLAPRYLAETERHTGRFDLTGALTSTLGMTALVYGFVRAASHGWGETGTVASFAASAVLLAAFAVTELRAEQPITPLRLFASRERSGAYVARVLLVSGMFASFFFLTQYLQGVRDYSPLKAGLAFLPMTGVMFAMVRVVPRITPRVGATRVLIGGLAIALVGMTWMTRISTGTDYFPQIAVPLVLIGLGVGLAFTPLTAAGIAGVAPADAGAASGLVNVAHQLGGSLGLGILVTVFAAAGDGLAHRVSTALTVGTGMLALALALVVGLIVRGPRRAAARAARSGGSCRSPSSAARPRT
jgi:predicted MFS family arabinose efflux permease